MHTHLIEIESFLDRLSAQMERVPKTEIFLARLLVSLGRELSARLDERIRPLGLNEVEFRLLVSLFPNAEAPVYPSDLCSRISQSPANITRITDGMVERDLITRVPSALDRRRLVLQLTPKGEALVRDLMPTMWSSLENTFADFSNEERQLLVTLLKRLGSSFLESERAPAPETTP